MKQVKYSKRNWRIIKTPTRQQIDLAPFMKGLQVTYEPETLDNAYLTIIDGMIYYSKLLRTDWETTAYTPVVVDNITTVLKANVPECAA